MKIKTFIDREHDEEIVIYAHERGELVEEIEALVLSRSSELIGYRDSTIKPINVADVQCFTVEDNKVYAVLERERWQIKQRLYNLEEILDKSFIKINQSCIANLKKIEKFEVSFGGSFLVIFKNGHKDYVSRRQLKNVKERIGI